VKAIIIDEVHLLYNTQRGLQLSILIQRLKQNCSHIIQWAALSATVGRLTDIRDFLFSQEEKAHFLQYPSHRSIDAHIRHIQNDTAFLNLIHLLTERPIKLLIFVNARKECERLASFLRQNKNLNTDIYVHYSSLSPNVRVETEQSFSKSKSALCIATSTLELGIDIGDIDAVLLWGVPGNVESFLQRIGRGNRRSNKTNVICLVTDDSSTPLGEFLRFAALVDAGKKGELSIKSPFELFGAAGQQFLSIIASDGGRFTRIADLCKLVEHKEHLNRPIAEEILAELGSNDFLQAHGFKNQYGADDNLHKLVDFKLIYGNYGASTQEVEVRHGAKVLGNIPTINLLKIRYGILVQFVGKKWKVCKITTDSIVLEPSKAKGPVLNFIYPGGGVGFEPFLTNRIWQLIHMDKFPDDIIEPNLRNKIIEGLNIIRGFCGINDIPYIQTAEGYIKYYTFAGYLVNKAAALYTEQPDFNADDISLTVPFPINWGNLPYKQIDYEPFFHNLFEASSEQSIFQSLLPPELQIKEFLQEWLKNEAISDILKRLTNSTPLKFNPNIISTIA
jgi:ATP-dependent Lhr-like helicase